MDAGIPIFDYVFAVSVAHTGKAVLSDTNRLEEISMGGASIPRMTIAAFARQPAEANLLVDLEAPPCLGPDRLSSMLESGSTAITKLFEIFDGTVVRPEVDALYQAKKF